MRIPCLLIAALPSLPVWPQGPVLSGFANRVGVSAAVAGDVVEFNVSGLPAAVSYDGQWPLPETVSGIEVTCGAWRAPILAIASNRIRVQLPWELLGLRTTPVAVKIGNVAGPAYQLELSPFAPAVVSTQPGVVRHGERLVVNAIGLGPRIENPPNGVAPSAQYPGNVATRFYVTVGGVPAPVISHRLSQDDGPSAIAGVSSIVVEIPHNTPSGAGVPVQVVIGGQSSDPFPIRIEPSSISMSLDPRQADVPISASQPFTLSRSGIAANQIRWSANQNGYDLPNTPNQPGRMSGSLFEADNYYVSPSWTIVRADLPDGAFATALVNIVSRDRKRYRILPQDPVWVPGEQLNFRLVDDEGADVPGVAWSISDGYFSSSSNTFTPSPSSRASRYLVIARLLYSPFYYDVAATSVLVSPPKLLPAATVPPVLHIEDIYRISGTGLGGTGRVWFSAAGGGQVPGVFLGESARVPRGAVSGPARVEIAAPGQPTFLSPPFPVTVLPRLRLHPSRQLVSSGETISIDFAAPDVPGNWTLTWRADLGAIDSIGRFTAPVVTAPDFARIWGCLRQTTECATTIVEVRPFRIEPSNVVIEPGETIQLAAWRGTSELPVSWRALTSNITVTPTGAVTAGAGRFDGGKAVVLATSGSSSLPLEVVVRGNGAIVNTAEYIDLIAPANSFSRPMPVGTHASSVVAVKGNWIYSVATAAPRYTGGPWQSAWLDVYQLDSRLRPVWRESVEATPPSGMRIERDILFIYGPSGEGTVVLRYDVSAGRPRLIGRQYSPVRNFEPPRADRSFRVVPTAESRNQITLEIRDSEAAPVRRLKVNHSLPVADYTAVAAGTSRWVAIVFRFSVPSGSASELVVCDVTGDEAVPFAVFPIDDYFAEVTVLGETILASRNVFVVDGQSVEHTAEIPIRRVIAADPEKRLVLGVPIDLIQIDGVRVVDLSDPRNPRSLASTVHPTQSQYGGALGNGFFVLSGGYQNVGVFPIRNTLGPAWERGLPSAARALEFRGAGNYLFTGGLGLGGRGRTASRHIFEVFDVSSQPIRKIAGMDRPVDSAGLGLELHEQFAYLGTDKELVVYDVSNPTAPIEKSVLPIPAISIFRRDRLLYVASASGTSGFLAVFDVSAPGTLRELTRIPLRGVSLSIAAAGNWLAVALGRSGMTWFSLENPSLPVSRSELSDIVWSVTASKNTIFGAGDRSGLRVWDASSSTIPELLAIKTLAIGDEESVFPAATAVTYDPRGIIWVNSNKDARIYGLDVRSPANPRHIAELVCDAGIEALDNAFVYRDRLYVGDRNYVFDISFPQNVGIYEVRQPPGYVRPVRTLDVPPVATGEPSNVDPPRVRELMRRLSPVR